MTATLAPDFESTLSRNERSLAREFVRNCQTRRLRTLREFATQELILPDGPFSGMQFRVDRQPWAGLWFDAIDAGGYQTYALTSGVQNGKTLVGSNAPLTWHLFEIGETVIYGLPDMNMAADKWREDIEPVIAATRYRDLIPTTGAGSRRGGGFDAIKFKNGATLKFMSAGGGDNKRSGFTARVVVITEADKFDAIKGTSKETDPITQIISRTTSFDDRARVYMECTVSFTDGRIWQEITGGTATEIYLPCPACGEFVLPGEAHLVGWQDAETELDAQRATLWCCPSCGAAWSEEQRRQANRSCVPVSAGQRIEGRQVIGEPRPTLTYGLRVGPACNLLLSSGSQGAKAWKAARMQDEEAGRRWVQQFLYVQAVEPSVLTNRQLDSDAIARRINSHPRGVVPGDATFITVFTDCAMHGMHWAAVAWREDGGGYVVDYGVIEVNHELLGIERALLEGLRKFQKICDDGWIGADNKKRSADIGIADSGWMPYPIYQWHVETGAPMVYLPSKGFGVRTYVAPKVGGDTVAAGDGWHIKLKKDAGNYFLLEFDTDFWKTFAHERVTQATDKPGAVTLFKADPRTHHAFSRHITAEEKVTEFVPGKGTIERWDRKRRNNHWLDALVGCSVGASILGIRLA